MVKWATKDLENPLSEFKSCMQQRSQERLIARSNTLLGLGSEEALNVCLAVSNIFPSAF